MSWCTAWKCQTSLPLFASTHTSESEKRFAPGRRPPNQLLSADEVEKDVVEVGIVAHPAPHVGAAIHLGGFVKPRVIAERSTLRHRVERPDLLACSRVVRLHVPRGHLLRART